MHRLIQAVSMIHLRRELYMGRRPNISIISSPQELQRFAGQRICKSRAIRKLEKNQGSFKESRRRKKNLLRYQESFSNSANQNLKKKKRFQEGETTVPSTTESYKKLEQKKRYFFVFITMKAFGRKSFKIWMGIVEVRSISK